MVQIRSLHIELVLIVLLGLSAAFLFGCANKKVKGPCQELDWYELGRADGAHGLENSKMRQVKPVCEDSDASLSEAVYQNGFDSAISTYCTQSNGFEAGTVGKSLNVALCPVLLRDEFETGYEHGSRFSQLQKSHSEVTSRLESLKESLSDKNLDIARRGLLRAKEIELTAQIKILQTEIASLKREQDTVVK